MKRVKCPKCNNYITFDETHYADGQQLIFECPDCRKQFSIRIGMSHLHASVKEGLEETSGECGCIVVIENVFHYKQVIPLQMGDNVIGRYVKGTSINTPIETADPSVDTKHCIIRVQRSRQREQSLAFCREQPKVFEGQHNKHGELQYILRDAPSNTGTFYQNKILKDSDRIRLEDGSVITIGATSIILHTKGVPRTL